MEHYRMTIAIQLLDSLILQMVERFRGKERQAGALLFLVPSEMSTRTEEYQEHIEGMLNWERDLPFPKSLGSELRRWQALWQHKDDSEGGKTSKNHTILFSLSVVVMLTHPRIFTASLS